jgi:hypothetical protein
MDKKSGDIFFVLKNPLFIFMKINSFRTDRNRFYTVPKMLKKRWKLAKSIENGFSCFKIFIISPNLCIGKLKRLN